MGTTKVATWGMGVLLVRGRSGGMENMSNHLARVLAVTLIGQGGKVKSATTSLTVGHSMRAACGVGGGSMISGGHSITTISTRFESLEGRGVS